MEEKVKNIKLSTKQMVTIGFQVVESSWGTTSRIVEECSMYLWDYRIHMTCSKYANLIGCHEKKVIKNRAGSGFVQYNSFEGEGWK